MRKIYRKEVAVISFALLVIAQTAYGQRVPPGVAPQHYQQQQYGQPQQQYQQPPQHPPQQQMHVAPGVAPQQYQQQPPVQYQQVPVQQQQQPQQHQQQQQFQQQQQQPPPQQYQQQQVPQGHPPQQHPPQQHPPQQQQQQHHQQQQPHNGHHGQQQVLNAANMEHERAHIQEHMAVPIDTSKMSEAELQFHYFKMHDSDNNNKLDGCELIKSLIHWHEQGSKEQAAQSGGHVPHVEEKVFSDEELVALIDPILQMDDTSGDGFIDYPEFIKAQQKAAAASQQKQQQQQHQQQQQQQQPQH